MASPRSEPGLTIHGRFYTGTDSRSRPARLSLAEGRLQLDTGPAEHRRELTSREVTLSPRVGNTPRYLYLPDDGVFETTENDQVDILSRRIHQGLGARLVHRLENHLGLILAAALATTLVTVLTFTHGIPALSSLVARALPDELASQLSQETLQQMDDFMLSPSGLPAERQRSLQAHFTPLLASEPEHSFQVMFRSGEGIGANAFALPDGTIIFTDDMVQLAKHPDELSAVLAHEMGHVVANHGLRGVVQSSLVGWMIVMMTGDLSAASDMVVVAPALLMNLSYSRGMEREADAYALELMLAEGLEPSHFSNLMLRLEASHQQRKEKGSADTDSNGWGERIGGALSSHPLTRERIEQFERASAQ